MEATVNQLLKTDPALTAIVSTRIFPVIPEQDTDLPYLVYQRQTTESQLTLSGVTGPDMVELVIDYWADTFTEVANIANAVRDILNGYRGGDVQGMFLIDGSSEVEEVGYHGTQTYRVFASW